MRRVVIDAGVLISAVIAPTGPPAQLLQAARDQRLDLVVSPRLLAEVAAVLERKKFRPYLTLEEVAEYVEGLALLAETVSDADEPPRVSRDPNDDYLVAIARASGAEAVVSGDADLLAVDVRGCVVIRPVEALASLD